MLKCGLLLLSLILVLATAVLRGGHELLDLVTRTDPGQLVDAMALRVQEDLSYALAVIAAILVLEAMLPFVPLGPVVAANAALFGPWAGLFISWAGALLGAIVCFALARFVAAGAVSKRLEAKGLARYTRLASEHGFHLLVLGRLTPGVNAFISYIAGLSPVSFRLFLVTSIVGLFPWVAFYTFVSHNLAEARSVGPWLLIGCTWLALYAAGARSARTLRRLAGAEPGRKP